MADVADIVADSTSVHALILLPHVMYQLQTRTLSKATEEHGQTLTANIVLTLRSLCKYNNDLFCRYSI